MVLKKIETSFCVIMIACFSSQQKEDVEDWFHYVNMVKERGVLCIHFNLHCDWATNKTRLVSNERLEFRTMAQRSEKGNRLKSINPERLRELWSARPLIDPASKEDAEKLSFQQRLGSPNFWYGRMDTTDKQVHEVVDHIKKGLGNSIGIEFTPIWSIAKQDLDVTPEELEEACEDQIESEGRDWEKVKKSGQFLSFGMPYYLE